MWTSENTIMNNLVFFDIDGTLAIKTDVPESAQEALKVLRAAGNKVFICTGRNPAYVKKFFSEYADGFICSNGRMAFMGDEVLYDHPLSREQIIDIEERLENNLGIKRFVQMTARTGIYTILVGIAFGFLGTNTVLLLIMMIVFTIAFVIGGMYTGYHMGFDSKTMVYAVGAILLWISGFDVLLRRVLDIF